MTNPQKDNLAMDVALAERAVTILEKSAARAESLLQKAKQQSLSDDERETLDAFTSRFGRAFDFLTQRLLRSIDKLDLTDEGSVLDRVNRFKKRGVLREDVNYGLIKNLRNQIVHEYIIEETDQVVRDALLYVPIVREILVNACRYAQKQGFLS